MPGGSKKRKASELEHETTFTNTKQPQKQTNKNRTSVPSADEIPFTAYCPVTEATKFKTKDRFVENREIVPGYAFNYAVEPGSKWTSMKSYRNVKYSENTFTIGGIVYINNKSPPPKPPLPTASDAELLAYDRENFWVARIADTRAESDRAVYLRVFWLYWPEELPMGRQPYHANSELIMSNAMEVLDAQTIASAADVTYWDENDMGASIFGERFWRQTFDIGKLGKDRKGGLSVLKKHCVCHQPYNPDDMMYQCKNSTCQMWNHEACLLDDLMKRSWDAYERDALDDLDVQHVTEEDKAGESGVFSKVGQNIHDQTMGVVKAVADQALIHKTEGTPESKPTDNHTTSKPRGRPRKSEPAPKAEPLPNQKGRGRPRKSDPADKSQSADSVSSRPQEGRLRISIIESGDKVDEPVLANVEELTDSKDAKKSKTTSTTGRKWTIPVQCLVCRNVME